MIEIIEGDITRLTVDAIVNAANPWLMGGGGVDGAIHLAAGPRMYRACEKIGGCPRGESVMTPGFDLKAKYVIHTPGPVWEGGSSDEPKTLVRCYVSALELAMLNDVKSLAFPCISTGGYRFPRQLAARIAYRTVSRMLRLHRAPARVIFCCYAHVDFVAYCEARIENEEKENNEKEERKD